jgi:hypothetical protein
MNTGFLDGRQTEVQSYFILFVQMQGYLWFLPQAGCPVYLLTASSTSGQVGRLMAR